MDLKRSAVRKEGGTPGGVGGGDQSGDLPFQFGGFRVYGDDAFEAATAQSGADAAVVAEQVDRGTDPGAGGQDRDLLLVAGSQAAQFGVGPVDQGAAFSDQVLAVIEQGSQVRRGADGEPDRRELLLTGGDAGDRQCVDRVGFAFAQLAVPFA
jgi:hypothetical protein